MLSSLNLKYLITLTIPIMKSVKSKEPLLWVSAKFQIWPRTSNDNLLLIKISLALSPLIKPLIGPQPAKILVNLYRSSTFIGGIEDETGEEGFGDVTFVGDVTVGIVGKDIPSNLGIGPAEK